MKSRLIPLGSEAYVGEMGSPWQALTSLDEPEAPLPGLVPSAGRWVHRGRFAPEGRGYTRGPRASPLLNDINSGF